MKKVILIDERPLLIAALSLLRAPVCVAEAIPDIGFEGELPKPVAVNRDAKWFEIKNQTADSADIYLYDEISPWLQGTSAQGVIAQLRNLKDVKTLNVHINSPGGSVFEGVAIYNALARHPGDVIVHVDGLAASIASVIMLAGKEIRIAENAMVMIHDPSCGCFGGSKDLRKQADVLDMIKDSIVNVYTARTGKKRETVAKMMTEETWMTAEDAVKEKFADSKVKAMKVAACFDVKNFGFTKTPNTLTAPIPEPDKTTTTPSNSRSRERKLALLERVAKQ